MQLVAIKQIFRISNLRINEQNAAALQTQECDSVDFANGWMIFRSSNRTDGLFSVWQRWSNEDRRWRTFVCGSLF